MTHGNFTSALPREELVQQGLADLKLGCESDESLLVLIAAPRLRDLGIEVPDSNLPGPCEHALYSRLEERLGPGAHSSYNSLIRRIVSYVHALERERSKPPAS